MDHLQILPAQLCLTKAGAAAGTTTTLTTANAVTFALKGKAFTRAALTNAATPTTDFNTGVAFLPVAVGTGNVFVLAFDAGGNLRVMQGVAQALDAAGNFVIAPQLPVVPENVAPFAYLVTRVGSTGAAWTFGVSNLAGPPTGVTHTFVDVISLPDRPQIS